MQLLKSIFCLSGFDNRQRYCAICGISYLSFLLLSAILAGHVISSALVLFIAVIICVFTTRRRLQDARLNKNWSFAPGVIFALTGLVIISVNHGGAYWLLLMPMALSALLLTYPGKPGKTYQLGYNGPVDLHKFHRPHAHSSQAQSRIEPTLTATGEAEQTISFDSHEPAAPEAARVSAEGFNDDASHTDPGEQIRLLLLNKKNALYAGGIILAFIITGILVSLLFSSREQQAETPENSSQPRAQIQQDEKLHKIDLPDNFSLMLNQYQGVIINWQSDKTEQTQIWSLKSAEGDSSCEKITFNNGESYRTYAVTTEMGDSYFASFSPLDTQPLLQAIAFRGNFRLCGYKFSLKGSQAVLGKNNHYANFIDY
ncbi:hypothetical protein SG34_008495 [Thalassomonas viridans]|uniref:DUF805 domain-containing protein n=1 Tax=Thalassomonas viridans TaxID=137584 RepID=A0AAF0CB41_9GAMM|nr:hypothetical protein [Thalassomonas viridans]WDE06915.1 hypothetical protein SG34_008495 [Thalassomonas viridans]